MTNKFYIEEICKNCKGNGRIVCEILCSRTVVFDIKMFSQICQICNGYGFDIRNIPTETFNDRIGE